MRSLAEDPDLVASCRDMTSAGAMLFGRKLAKTASHLVPKPPVDIVDWAADKLTLPVAASGRSGPLVLSPPQAAIARLWQTPGIRQVSFLKPVRWGSSLMNAVGLLYFSGHEGVDTIFYERTSEDAQDFHDKKLFPMLTETVEICHLKRPDTKAGVQDSWTDRILTNGASIQLRSASNNGSFRAIKGGFICVDEAGAKEYFDRSKHSEGSKLSLIRRRAQEYSAPVIYLGGTPTKSSDSMIWAEWQRSDKRKFFMPCPHCGVEIEFVPDVKHQVDPDAKYGPGLRYDLDQHGVVNEAWYECGECAERIPEKSKHAMMENCVLRATAVGEKGHAGVYAWAIFSTDLQMTWRHIAAEHQKALADPAEMAPFWNTILALPYDASPIARVEPSVLESRKERWLASVPAWIDMLFCGIDVQRGTWDDQDRPPRIEASIIGLGRNQRRAVIDHVILDGYERLNPHTGKTDWIPVVPFDTVDSYRMLWDLLTTEFETEDGRRLRIRKTCVDVGYNAESILQWIANPKTQAMKNVIPVRGSSSDLKEDKKPILPANLDLATSRMGRGGKLKAREYLEVGTRRAKDYLAECLANDLPAPKSVAFAEHLPRSYFEGLLAETKVEESPGEFRWKNLNKRKNTGEPWDCAVYAYAAEQHEMRQNPKLQDLYYRVDPAAAAQAQAAKQAMDAASGDGTALPGGGPIFVPQFAMPAPARAGRPDRIRRPEKPADDEQPVVADRSNRLRRAIARSSRRLLGW